MTLTKYKYLILIILIFQTFTGGNAFSQWVDDQPWSATDCVTDNGTTIGIVKKDIEILPVKFTFDNLGDYFAGIIISGKARLLISVVDNASGFPCVWGLRMLISNFGLPDVTPNWTSSGKYGSNTGLTPDFSLLEVRVHNQCNTPDNAVEVFKKFPIVPNNLVRNEYVVDIIDNVIANPPNPGGADPCDGANNTQVNMPGDFQTYYNRYSFQVDFRIKPGFVFQPGVWNVQVQFELYEH